LLFLPNDEDIPTLTLYCQWVGCLLVDLWFSRLTLVLAEWKHLLRASCNVPHIVLSSLLKWEWQSFW
jgi:hypothetical protein